MSVLDHVNVFKFSLISLVRAHEASSITGGSFFSKISSRNFAEWDKEPSLTGGGEIMKARA